MMERTAGSPAQGLCTAGTVGFAVSVAFLTYWGFEVFDAWTLPNQIVAASGLLGCLLLGLVPLFATRSSSDPVSGRMPLGAARWAFGLGILLVWVALVVAVLFTPIEKDTGTSIRETRLHSWSGLWAQRSARTRAERRGRNAGALILS